MNVRRTGDFLGVRQLGAPPLRFAGLQTDAAVPAWARQAVVLMLDQYPDLAERHVLRWLGGRLSF